MCWFTVVSAPKPSKETKLVQLVESYRNAEGQPRQRVMVSLGDAALPELEMPAIARAVANHLAGHTELLPAELSEQATGWVRRMLQLASRSKSARPFCSQTIDGAVVDRVQSENIVQLGPQLVALEAWESLGLTSMLLARINHKPSAATCGRQTGTALGSHCGSDSLIPYSPSAILRPPR